MTDKSVLIEMLERVEIKYRVHEADLEIHNDDNKDGYGGFYSVFTFDQEGYLTQIASWE